MKFVIMIHSNPQPWGHPTADFLPEHRALPQEQRERMSADFDGLLAELQDKGELVTAAALGDPATSTLYRWRDGEPRATEGPYAASNEHLAGYFVVDVADRARAEELAARFAGPGETVELRPTA